jgi:hypothetical protein
MATLDEPRRVKRKHSADLLHRPGVVGVDIDADDSGELVLTVHLATADPSARDALPEELDGFPVNYVYTGEIRKQ